MAGAGEAPVPTLPNVNLLLGNIGARKSTIFPGIALALTSPVVQPTGYPDQVRVVGARFGAHQFLHRRKDEGQLMEARLQSADTFRRLN
jgi:hypothetical protein